MKIPDLLRTYSASLYSSIKRFPISIALSTSAAILLIILLHSERSLTTETQEIIGRVAMVLALGIPISLCIKLIMERKENIQPLVYIGINLIAALALLLYYFFWLPDLKMVSVTRYIGLSLSFYLAFLTVPYFFKRDHFEFYVIKLLSHFFITAIFSAVLFLGICAILFTLDSLLGVKVDKIYIYTWLLVVGIFSPCFFLSGVPLYDDGLELWLPPKLLQVLSAYIVIPLVYIYTLILYIYFAKILITLQWPIGVVANLVLWYSIITSLIAFFISPFIAENRWFRTFVFLLPKLILPLLVMMFISIGIRVNAYGITENRYYIIALGLWSLGIMLYLSLAKNRRNIIMVISISLIAFLSVVGPWSSYSISKFSQNKRFESILLKYHMINNNTIVRTDQVISDNDKTEIGEILRYFSQDHNLSDLKALPDGFKIDQTKDLFGFSYTDYQNYINNRKYFNYTSDINNRPIDINGYSSLIAMKNYSTSSTFSDNKIDVFYGAKSHEIRINSEGKEIYRCFADDLAKRVINKFGAKTTNSIDQGEMTFFEENEKIKVKFVFQDINGYQDVPTDTININNINFFLLLNIK